jgi:hypothetical protein
MKEQIKNGWEKFKTWVKAHKAAVILGSAALVAGAVGVAVSASRSDSHEKEGEEILKALEASLESDYNDVEYKDVDRYTIDKQLMDQLPAGTYNVFDGYENERVDYVVAEKESMET